MNYLKKFGLLLSAAAFCLTLYVGSADAQQRRWDRNRNWENRNNTWRNQNDRRRWRNRTIYSQSRNYRWWGNNNGRISPQEYRRLQRQRNRLYRTQNRYYRNDGYINQKERRELRQRYNRYRRNVYRDRRDW